jgi:hypothetical protein
VCTATLLSTSCVVIVDDALVSAQRNGREGRGSGVRDKSGTGTVPLRTPHLYDIAGGFTGTVAGGGLVSCKRGMISTQLRECCATSSHSPITSNPDELASDGMSSEPNGVHAFCLRSAQSDTATPATVPNCSNPYSRPPPSSSASD